MYEDDPQDTRLRRARRGRLRRRIRSGGAIIGTREVVGAVRRPPSMRAFHDGRYATQNVVVAAAGAVDHDRIVELASRRPSATRPRLDAPPAPLALPGTAQARTSASSRKDTEQYHVALGAPGLARDDDRRFALRVLDTILGGSSSSRLFQEVREQRGLAYSVYSFTRALRRTRARSALPRHAAGQRAEGDEGRQRRARQACCADGITAEELDARQGERQGPRRAGAGVDGGAHEPPRLLGAGRHAGAHGRRGRRAHRRGHAR